MPEFISSRRRHAVGVADSGVDTLPQGGASVNVRRTWPFAVRTEAPRLGDRRGTAKAIKERLGTTTIRCDREAQVQFISILR